eukprot:TRINITY_DN2791_c0_g4_i3.p1 TRINITY_DN2791_c0_g4~~TRINITY_DN2791_c0_g4_i3.p1  ORF type:complete len:114 (-),score=13.97 TRINITY_DN2791_c0_g4_i3:42-383(-)
MLVRSLAQIIPTGFVSVSTLTQHCHIAFNVHPKIRLVFSSLFLSNPLHCTSLRLYKNNKRMFLSVQRSGCVQVEGGPVLTPQLSSKNAPLVSKKPTEPIKTTTSPRQNQYKNL